MTRPNILFVIADDQSWPHAGAYGAEWVKTPAFDRIAAEGVLFHNAYCNAPQCSPARAAALTGRPFWQLGSGSVLSSYFPDIPVFPDLLEEGGYAIGFTGKGWGPGEIREPRTRNPAGPAFNEHFDDPPSFAQVGVDYTANFKAFLDTRASDQPFCFWFGATEPHRPYEEGSGLRQGGRLEDVMVPAHLPDDDATRSDLLDYAAMIAWYDHHLGRILDHLEEIGELDQTLVVCTADNGMPFPRSKANVYDDSCHVPMAIRWGSRIDPGQAVTDFVTFEDLLPTFCEVADVDAPADVVGRSILPLLEAGRSGRIDESRDHVITGRERHAPCHPNNAGYPSRAILTDVFHFVINYKPDRWPAGGPEYGFADTDGGPTKRFVIENRESPGLEQYFRLAFAKRPGEELYDLRTDVDCLVNCAGAAELEEVQDELRERLKKRLRELRDPRELAEGDIFDTYEFLNPLLKVQDDPLFSRLFGKGAPFEVDPSAPLFKGR